MIQRLIPTAEQQQILKDEKTPVLFVDHQGCATHVVLPIEEARRLFDDFLRNELQPAFLQADQGGIAPLDIEVTIAKARQSYSSQDPD